MATKFVHSIIHFQDVDTIDWISNNFINSRGGRFVAPVTDNVTEFMPVIRETLDKNVFIPCKPEDPALFVCQKIFIDNGVRYGVIDCSIRTVKYTGVLHSLELLNTYNITTGNWGPDVTDPGVTVTDSTSGILFRIIDWDSVKRAITYINA